MKKVLFLTGISLTVWLSQGCAHSKAEKVLAPIVTSLEDNLRNAALTASGPCGQKVIETYAICKAQIEEAKTSPSAGGK